MSESSSKDFAAKCDLVPTTCSTPTSPSASSLSSFSQSQSVSFQSPEKIFCEKYLEPEKVPVRLVRNCGLLLDDGGLLSDEFDSSSKSRRKKDSIFQPAHKIPIEIRRSARTSKKGWRRYGGIIFGVFASFSFSLTVLLAKVLQNEFDYHPICITVWRYLGILVPALPIAAYYKFCCPDEDIFDSIWPLNEWKHVRNVCGYIMQGILGCTCIIFRFYSLKFLTVADSSAIAYSTPVFVTILAHFCLKEKCGVVSILTAVCTALGVVVIARPPMLTGQATYDSKLWVGAVLAVASMICASFLLILLRNIRQVHFSLLLLVSGGWGVLQSSVLGFSLNIMKHPESTKESFLVILLCILTFCGQISVVLAIKYENAGPVAVIRSSEVLFAFTWELLFLSVYPDGFSLCGAGIIVFAVIVTALRKWVAGLPSDNVYRKWLWFLIK